MQFNNECFARCFARLKTVAIARDLGRDIELASRISLGDRIITAPPDGIANGDRVRTTGIDKERGAAKTGAKIRQ